MVGVFGTSFKNILTQETANHFLLPFVFSARTESALHNLCISFTLRVTLELRKRTTNPYSKLVHIRQGDDRRVPYDYRTPLDFRGADDSNEVR